MWNRRIGFVAVPTFLSLAVLTSGCARQEESIIVDKAITLTAPCSVADGSDTYSPRGVVDISFDTGFMAAFLLVNNLQQQGAENSSTGVEPSEMHLTSVDVRLDMPQDSAVISDVNSVDGALVEYNQILASTSFDAQDTIEALVEVPEASFDALRNSISARYADDVRLTMTMNVTFHAVRASNKGVNDFGEIDAREFTYPVDLCFNCLRDCSCGDPDCATDMDVGTGVCGYAQGQTITPLSCDATLPP
jgi:hypothetical protein